MSKMIHNKLVDSLEKYAGGDVTKADVNDPIVRSLLDSIYDNTWYDNNERNEIETTVITNLDDYRELVKPYVDANHANGLY